MSFFTPIVPPDKYHRNFATVLETNNPDEHALFSCWADGFKDRDGKSVLEFQTTFNSSFWDIYLFAALKHRACAVDFSYHAPDFVVTAPTPFTMEATVASNAQGALPEHTPVFDFPLPWNLNEFSDRSEWVRPRDKCTTNEMPCSPMATRRE
jgi:hypothetical protein